LVGFLEGFGSEPLRYLVIDDLDAERTPSQVHRCRTNAEENMALVANATREPLLSKCFGMTDPFSANATMPRGRTLCGSSPVTPAPITKDTSNFKVANACYSERVVIRLAVPLLALQEVLRLILAACKL
jgi:hypothetical protein